MVVAGAHNVLPRAESMARVLSDAAPEGQCAGTFCAEAQRLLRLGRVSEAARLLTSPEALAEGDEKSHLEAGKLLLGIGDFQGACQRFARAIFHSPRSKIVALHDEALQRLAEDAEVGISPALKYKYFKGLERLCRGNPDGAAVVFAKVARRARQFAPAWIGWRGALEAAGRAEEAAAIANLWSSLGGPAPAIIASATRRRLSARGLLFDPHEPVRWRKKEDVLRHASKPAELKDEGDSFYLMSQGGQRRMFQPALTADGRPDTSLCVRYRTRDVFVASISDAALVGRGAVLTRNGELVYDLMVQQDAAKYGGAWADDQMRFDPSLFRDGACIVTFFDKPAFLMAGPTDTSFGDWMLNFLPRLALAEAADLDCNIVIRSDPLGTAVEMLGVLGVPKSRLVFHDVHGVSVFPKLYAPSWPLPAFRPMDGLFDVFRRAVAPAGAPTGRRLYLTRQGLGRRPLVNEAEIQEIFVRRGFEVVRPEALSVTEMRRVFASPAYVAGPYGSGLLNLAFCKSNPGCLFFVPPERPSFLKQLAQWMSGMGLTFHYLLGEPASAGVDHEEKLAPWRLRKEDVESLIDRMLTEGRPPDLAMVQ